jgi:hypothetical protein
LRGGVNEYGDNADFTQLLQKQLMTYLNHVQIAPPKPVTAPLRQFSGIPYRGLNALNEEDSSIFFGREAETLEVLYRIESRRTVMVLGASGSGKSSLVGADVERSMTELLPIIVIFLVMLGKPFAPSVLLFTAVKLYTPPPKQIVDGVLALFELTMALMREETLEATTVWVQAMGVGVSVGVFVGVDVLVGVSVGVEVLVGVSVGVRV